MPKKRSKKSGSLTTKALVAGGLLGGGLLAKHLLDKYKADKAKVEAERKAEETKRKLEETKRKVEEANRKVEEAERKEMEDIKRRRTHLGPELTKILEDKELRTILSINVEKQVNMEKIAADKAKIAADKEKIAADKAKIEAEIAKRKRIINAHGGGYQQAQQAHLRWHALKNESERRRLEHMRDLRVSIKKLKDSPDRDKKYNKDLIEKFIKELKSLQTWGEWLSGVDPMIEPKIEPKSSFGKTRRSRKTRRLRRSRKSRKSRRSRRSRKSRRSRITRKSRRSRNN